MHPVLLLALMHVPCASLMMMKYCKGCWEPIVKYIDDTFIDYLRDESSVCYVLCYLHQRAHQLTMLL